MSFGSEYYNPIQRRQLFENFDSLYCNVLEVGIDVAQSDGLGNYEKWSKYYDVEPISKYHG